jgi:hypothetical protein
MPPELQDIEKRLRDQEIEMAGHRGDVRRVLETVAEISTKMDGIMAIAMKVNEVDRIDSKAEAAHRRLNEFATVMMEHNTCYAKQSAEALAFTDLTIRVNRIETTTASLVKSEVEVKGWFSKRATNLVDKALPAIATMAAVLLALSVSGVSVQNNASKIDSDKLKKIEATLEILRSNQIIQIAQPKGQMVEP